MSKYVFITERGASTNKSAVEKRIVRSHVMQEFRRTERRPRSRLVHKPTIRVPLEIPQSFMWRHGGVKTDIGDQDSMRDFNISNSDVRHTVATGSFYGTAVQWHSSDISQIDEESYESLSEIYHDSRSFIDRFGGGRRNVLFKFPIEMSSRKHELLDHGRNNFRMHA